MASARHIANRSPSEAAGRWLVRLLLAAAIAVIFVPLVLTIYLSVFDETLITFPPHAYTTRWYARILPEFGGALRTSLLVALAAVAVSLVLGVPAAIGLARHRFRGRGALSTLLLAPLTVPGIAIGLGIYVCAVLIEERTEWPLSGSVPVLVAAHVLIALPWVVRLCLAALANRDPAAGRKPPPASAPRPCGCCGASPCRPCAAASSPGRCSPSSCRSRTWR